MGSNDVQGHKGIDSKLQMQPNVKEMMIKDKQKNWHCAVINSTV